MEPNRYLVYSSICISFPGIVFFSKGEYPQASISFLCCFFSILWHSTKPRDPTILIIDQVCAYMTAALAIHQAARTLPYSLIPLSSFIGYPLVIYHLGNRYSCFSFDPDLDTSTRWHMSIHILNGITAAIMATAVTKK